MMKRKFLPELIGLSLALGAIRGNTAAIPRPERSPEEIQRRSDKQAAKLARRAKRAGF